MALQAEKLLEDMRAVARKHAVPDAMRTTLLGLADARVVHYLFNKPDDARGNFSSLSQIGHQFCQDVSSALGIDVESKWAPPCAAPARGGAAPTAASASGVKRYSAMGKWTNAHESVLALGFVVGATVLAKDAENTDENSLTIKTVSQGAVTLSDAAGKCTSHDHQVFLEKGFILVNKKEETLKNFLDHCPTKSPDWSWSLCEGRIKATMDQLYKAHCACLPNLLPIVAPQAKQGVRAIIDFKAGEIELVPLTPSVVNLKSDSKIRPSQIVLGEHWVHPATQAKHMIVLNRSGGLKLPPNALAPGKPAAPGENKTEYYMVSVFWLVERTDVEEDANVQIKRKNGIPILYNPRKISKDTTLKRYAPDKAAATDAARPKKRAKVA